MTAITTTAAETPVKKREPAPPLPREAYTVAELATTGYFRKSRIYELIDSRELGARLIGNKRVVPVEEWERFKRSLPSAPTGRYRPKKQR